jgi:NADPH-dependent ferric siderophore reductase
VDQPAIRPSRHRLRVVAVGDISASMRRVTVSAPTLTDLELAPAQDVGLVFADPAGREIRRRYTIRLVDRRAQTLSLEGILHGHGPGAAWFANVSPGAEIEAIGPRGKVALSEANWHLLAGDESALPAFAELMCIAPPGRPLIACVEVDGPEHEVDLGARAGQQIHWVHRNGADRGGSALLAAAIDGIAAPTGRGHVVLLGESRSVVTLRGVVSRIGIDGSQVFLKGYWNRTPGR